MWRVSDTTLRPRRLSRRTLLKLGGLGVIASVAALKLPSSPRSPWVTAGHILVPEWWRALHPPPYTLRLAVYVDEDWGERFGRASAERALAVIGESQRLLEGSGIALEPRTAGRWQIGTRNQGISALYSHLPARDAAREDIVVGLTAEYDGQEGGFTGSDGRGIVVKHHPFRLDHDSLVLTHEIGHDLGLEHHDCSDATCIMSSHDFDKAGHFCPEHLRVLRANAGLFMYQGDRGQAQSRE